MYVESTNQFIECLDCREASELIKLLRKIQLMIIHGRSFKISPITMLHLILNNLEKNQDLIEIYELYQYRCHSVTYCLKLTSFKFKWRNSYE